MSAPPPTNEWWNLPVGQIPESAQLEDMPPLLQALVRRNAALRRQLLDCHAMLKKANPEAVRQQEKDTTRLNTRIAELEQLLEEKDAMLKCKDGECHALKLEVEGLSRTNSEFEKKLENFRGMIERRDEKIAKLQKK